MLVLCVQDISYDNFECGHVRSRARGGTDKIDNLRPVCGWCDESLGTRDLEEFQKAYGFDKIERVETATNAPVLSALPSDLGQRKEKAKLGRPPVYLGVEATEAAKKARAVEAVRRCRAKKKQAVRQ